MLIPGLVLMGLLFTVLGAYPFVETWVTGDKREHHLLDRPRNQPTRTGFGVAGITAYGVLWAAGGNDIVGAGVPSVDLADHLVHAGSRSSSCP